MEAEWYRFLTFPNKEIRAKVIKKYMADHSYSGAVCFSCGNASQKLKEAGVDVLDISESGDLIAKRWFQPSEVARIFPTLFDATSGHLSVEVMGLIADAYKDYFGRLDGEYYIPTGSGETVVCLKMAFPVCKFIAVYNMDKATEYNENAVLNPMVKAVAEKVMFASQSVQTVQK